MKKPVEFWNTVLWAYETEMNLCDGNGNIEHGTAHDTECTVHANMYRIMPETRS